MAALDGDLQTGWSASGREGKPSHAVWQLAKPLTAKVLKLRMDFSRHYSASLGRFRFSVAKCSDPPQARDLPGRIEAHLARPEDALGQAGREALRRFYIETSKDLAEARKSIEALRQQLPKPATTLVMEERPAAHVRVTRRHHRGEFLSPRESVTSKVLPFLPPLGQDQPRNRLGFARWLVDKNNPLTARVVVNRFWATIFGEGIVRTTDDFGYTGAAPTDLKLLDWLAIEFMNSDWSQKKLLRLIVTSATYRKRSGASYRLSAEQIRDSVLSVSGLLNQKLGGSSVFPPQHKSTGEGIYGGGGWKTSTGAGRYRRSLYTYRKRSMPYAMHDTFDAPSHETCVANREISNTPLQALTLLNDQFFMEASQMLARELVVRKESETSLVKRLFERCLARQPDDLELQLSVKFYREQISRFENNELNAAKFGSKGEGNPNILAAWTILARAILNTHEFINRN